MDVYTMRDKYPNANDVIPLNKTQRSNAFICLLQASLVITLHVRSAKKLSLHKPSNI